MTGSFRWHHVELDLCDDAYNDSGLNERAVEIPIARHWLTGRIGHGLEIGNVLAHYGETTPRTIVDRYEQAPGVLNLDVLALAGSFDWIVTISTLEHVRWDEPPFDPAGAVEAVDRLRSMLTPGGVMLVTVPTGLHPALDAGILRDWRHAFGADRCCTMVRDGDGWRQTPVPEVRPYARPRWASAVWIGEWSRP